jgi:hypothetical protein
LVADRSFVPWVEGFFGSDKTKKPDVETLRRFAADYLLYADRVFRLAGEKDLRAEIDTLQRPSGYIRPSTVEVSGGAPGLGKR